MSSITEGLVIERTAVNRPPSGGGEGPEPSEAIHHAKGVLRGGRGRGFWERRRGGEHPHATELCCPPVTTLP